MKVKSEYVIFGVLGILVLYALTKIKPPEVQQVPEFISTGPAGDSASSSQAVRSAERASMFGTLAQLAGAQTSADLAKYQTSAQLEATNVAAGVQRYTADIGERLGLAGYASQEKQADIASQLAQFGYNLDFQRYLKGLETQASMYEQDLSYRQGLLSQQLAAIQQGGSMFRNQSLERQGSYYNAINQVFGGGMPYTYQSAFGGPRGPSVLQQLFPQGIGSTIAGFFGF